MFSRGIRADAGARVRARKNTAKYAAELRLYTRTRMFESGATSAFRVCVGARCSRARAAVCWWESRERERERERHADCAVVCRRRAALGRLAWVTNSWWLAPLSWLLPVPSHEPRYLWLPISCEQLGKRPERTSCRAL